MPTIVGQQPVMDGESSRLLPPSPPAGGALLGGASGLIVRTFPELLSIRCFCYKCGVQNLPECQTQDFAKATCFPLYWSCGAEQWNAPTYCQVCCLGCTGAALSCITSCPAFLRIQCLCYKCGCDGAWLAAPAAKLTGDEWCTGMCCCLFDACGLKDWCIVQYFCLKCIVA